MEQNFKIWQTSRESFGFVYHNFGAWMKLASAPLLIMIIAGLLVFAMGGTAQYAMGNEAGNVAGVNMEMAGAGIGILLVSIIGSIIAFLIFAVNAYRYAMFQEGGEKWLEFRFDHYMWKVFKFSIVVSLILMLVGGVGAGAVFLIGSMGIGLLTGVVGAVVALFVFYLAMRMSFVIPFAAIGIEKPIKVSMEISKGKVLRLLGLVIVLGLLFFLLSFVVMFVLGLTAGLMAVSQVLIVQSTGAVLMIIGQALVSLYTQGVMMTAIVLAYKKIAGK
ncbi:hypothetical protein Bealeia1_00529 [Candidatus Bealeia paramacronuclearis]|uniref:Glycerophosphoryl diester phosphodiesterase membrane domain-containing protein n=1 Tax=Candidatus Bealeia paramacronuclearis TaxID=1921001 RepID=A0ABZ2C1W0_9PROT|nr:hypothetical protein [Candidatus Bealeia paramacronuclearis]